MMLRSGLVGLVVSAVVLAVTGVGCSVIVSGDLPTVACVAAPGACPDGQHCDTGRSRCVDDTTMPMTEAGGPDADARDGNTADVVLDGDATLGPQDLGALCRLDKECKSSLCGTAAMLTTTIVGSTGPICTSPCCTSADCPTSFVCFDGGTGGAYCVPATLASRSPASAGQGKLPGTMCTNNSDCRSGLCSGTPKTCVDTCCTLDDCATGTTCRLPNSGPPAPAHYVFSCAAPDPGSTRLPGTSCTDSAQCVSDTCIGSGTSYCRPPCSNTASCRNVTGFDTGHCLYGSAPGSDNFRFCFASTFTSRSPAGDPCTDDGLCQSDYCDPELKICANVCGRDADCNPGEACRPSAAGTPKLRCVTKPQ